MAGFYDKVRLKRGRCGYDESIVQHLTNVQPIIKAGGEVVGLVGGCNGLKVQEFPSSQIVVGSFSKFMNDGSNFELLDYNGMGEAYEKLSDKLHMDFTSAGVTQIEFGTQFLMVEPVHLYLIALGYLPDFTRLPISTTEEETVYYKSGDAKVPPRMLKFYDKQREMACSGLNVPNGWDNLLKYELTLTRRLNRRFGIERASDLCDKRIYRRLAVVWQELYFKIEKQKQLNINFSDMTTPKQAKDTLFAILAAQNPETVNNFIAELVKSGALNRNSAYRLRQMVGGLLKGAEQSERIKELDDAVKNAAAYV